jgi:ATP-dependent Clp protease adaptor protein ClpS
MWHVVMLNDDYTPMDFVVALIQKVFHHPVEKATEIMLEVHRKGKGICGTYTLEVAEMKATQCIDVARRSEYPLLVGVERAPS